MAVRAFGSDRWNVHLTSTSLFVAAMLAIHAVLLAWTGFRYSPTFDEVGHLAAGLSHWEFGRFELYSVNPPLVRSVAAIPVILAGYECDWVVFLGNPGDRPAFPLGYHLIARNGERSFRLFMLARWACIPFSLLGSWICWRWASELYGKASGALALMLWCFSPMVLGFASLITPDVGAAAMGGAAYYVFWRWLKQPSLQQACFAGIMLGLASLTKFTLLIFYVIWPLTWVLWSLSFRRGKKPMSRRTHCSHLVVVLLVSLLVINLGYEFDGTFERLGSQQFLSDSLRGLDAEGDQLSRNRFRNTWLQQIPLPVPKEFLLGIDRQLLDLNHGLPSYLGGEWRDRGWYYYYIYGLLVKEPLGSWVLVVLALLLSVFRRAQYTCHWRDELVILLPIVVIMGLVSAHTGYNHHLRYALPVFPFVFVWASRVARSFALKHGRTASLAGFAAMWVIASSLSCYPHSLSYFNESVGGPRGGHYHLGSSNMDWGQDLLNLKDWLVKHPEVRLDSLGYELPLLDVSIVGIPRSCSMPPTSPEPGWHAISVNQIHDRGGQFQYFLRLKPVALAGYSIYIYHITLADANRVRAELKMPQLSDGNKRSPR